MLATLNGGKTATTKWEHFHFDQKENPSDVKGPVRERERERERERGALDQALKCT